MASPDGARRHPHAVFYGDSILTGWRGTSAPQRRWPVIVCHRLGWRETTLALDGMGYVRRRGPRGPSGEPAPSDTDTTLLDAAIRLAPDVLVVCLGANDLRFVDDDAARVERALRRDLRRLATELPTTRVVVTTYLPVAALSERAQRLHTWIDEACDEHGLPHEQALRRAIDGDPQLLCDDGVHPNDAGHTLLADVMTPVLRDLVPIRR